MELAEYQVAAATTAQPRAYDLAYLVPMIVGETGELFGQRAKSVWHGWSEEELTAELVSEFGDICWGTAMLLDMHSISTISGNVLLPGRSLWGAELDPWHTLLQKATGLHLMYISEETESARFLGSAAQQLWLTLQTTCQRITGKDFDTVLQANLAKLAGRVARGTLVGSGDHR